MKMVLKGKSSRPYRLLPIGDVHSGHRLAIMDKDGYTDSQGNTYLPNKHQIELCEKLIEIKDSIQKPDGILLGGDLCTGPDQPRFSGDIVLKNHKDQADHFLQLADKYIKGWRSADKIMVRGSGYHVGRQFDNMHVEDYIATKINNDDSIKNVIPNPNDNELAAYDHLITFPSGKRMHTTHYVNVSATTWQYRSTPLARELVLGLLESKHLGYLDIEVRFHAHYWLLVQFSQLGIISPCWQFRTPFMKQKQSLIFPKIGAYVLHIGEDVALDKFTWSVEKPKALELGLMEFETGQIKYKGSRKSIKISNR